MHNCFVDLGASSNVMPYSICKNISVYPTKWTTQIFQLDRSDVKVMDEIKDVMIRSASNPIFF